MVLPILLKASQFVMLEKDKMFCYLECGELHFKLRGNVNLLEFVGHHWGEQSFDLPIKFQLLIMHTLIIIY